MEMCTMIQHRVMTDPTRMCIISVNQLTKKSNCVKINQWKCVIVQRHPGVSQAPSGKGCESLHCGL